MEDSTGTTIAYWPLAVYFGFVLALAGAMLLMSYLMGERHRGRSRGMPFETGMPVTGSARLRYDVKFYLIATFFVVFDLEAVFLLSWAVAARDLGWTGYIEMIIFVVILLAALVYLWRTGALEWGSRPFKLTEHGREDMDNVTPL